MNDNPYNVTEKDLAIFPPKFSYFLDATLCLMVAHSLSMSIGSFYFLQLPPKWLIGFVLGTAPLFVFFNFRVIRGHSDGIGYLKILATIYLLVGLIAFIDITGQQINTTFSSITCAFSAAALLTLFSKGYLSFAQHVERRWRIYRETGRTLIEEFNRVKQANH